MKHLLFNKKVRILNWIRVEKLKRIFFIKHILKKKLIRSIALYDNLEDRKGRSGYIQYRFSNFPRLSMISKQKTLCVKSGRNKMVFRFCLMSRMQIRVFGRGGYLPFITKLTF